MLSGRGDRRPDPSGRCCRRSWTGTGRRCCTSAPGWPARSSPSTPCRQRFAGEPVDPPFGEDKAADFERLDPGRAAADYARLTEEFKHADAAVANASLDDTFTHDGEVMSLRLIYLHMIEEYARHLGHADLLREQIDGATGE